MTKKESLGPEGDNRPTHHRPGRMPRGLDQIPVPAHVRRAHHLTTSWHGPLVIKTTAVMVTQPRAIRNHQVEWSHTEVIVHSREDLTKGVLSVPVVIGLPSSPKSVAVPSPLEWDHGYPAARVSRVAAF